MRRQRHVSSGGHHGRPHLGAQSWWLMAVTVVDERKSIYDGCVLTDDTADSHLAQL